MACNHCVHGDVANVAPGQLEAPRQQVVEVVRVVPCEQSHVAEVFHVFDIALDDFPGQASVNSAADEACLAQFAGYVGAAYGTSEFGVGYIAPTEGTWNQLDDREVLCTLFRVDGAPKAGSARGSGR